MVTLSAGPSQGKRAAPLGGGERSERRGLLLLFLTSRFLEFIRELLLQRWRRGLVMAQLHGPRAVTARDRLEPRRVAVELDERCEPTHRENSGLHPFRAGDLAAARR